ncbi:hypothetical protein [Clostridium sp. DL1XJH146]
MIGLTLKSEIKSPENKFDSIENKLMTEILELPEQIGENFELNNLPDEISENQEFKEMANNERVISSEINLEEKISMQNDEILRVESDKKNLETTIEKGNYGEMKTDQDLLEKGYDRISNDRVTSLIDMGHQGIDGVYQNFEGRPQYLVVDAKYGSAQLSDTHDGKQMSDNWIDKRLDDCVGKERADDIRMEQMLNPHNVGSYISHIDEKGIVTYDKLDKSANVVERGVKINV